MATAGSPASTSPVRILIVRSVPKSGAIEATSVSNAAESTAPTSSPRRPWPSDQDAATMTATASGSVVRESVRLAAAGDTEKSRLTSGKMPCTT